LNQARIKYQELETLIQDVAGPSPPHPRNHQRTEYRAQEIVLTQVGHESRYQEIVLTQVGHESRNQEIVLTQVGHDSWYHWILSSALQTVIQLSAAIKIDCMLTQVEPGEKLYK